MNNNEQIKSIIHAFNNAYGLKNGLMDLLLHIIKNTKIQSDELEEIAKALKDPAEQNVIYDIIRERGDYFISREGMDSDYSVYVEFSDGNNEDEIVSYLDSVDAFEVYEEYSAKYLNEGYKIIKNHETDLAISTKMENEFGDVIVIGISYLG